MATGIIREFLEVHGHHRLVLLELQCIGCRRDEIHSIPAVKTKQWLTRDHWTEVLELLTPLALELLDGSSSLSLDHPSTEASKKKKPPPAYLYEGQTIRLAAKIRTRELGHGLRILVGSHKKWFSPLKIVASVAAINPNQPDDLGSSTRDLQATLGVRIESQICQYFIKTDQN